MKRSDVAVLCAFSGNTIACSCSMSATSAPSKALKVRPKHYQLRHSCPLPNSLSTASRQRAWGLFTRTIGKILKYSTLCSQAPVQRDMLSHRFKWASFYLEKGAKWSILYICIWQITRDRLKLCLYLLSFILSSSFCFPNTPLQGQTMKSKLSFG